MVSSAAAPNRMRPLTPRNARARIRMSPSAAPSAGAMPLKLGGSPLCDRIGTTAAASNRPPNANAPASSTVERVSTG